MCVCLFRGNRRGWLSLPSSALLPWGDRWTLLSWSWNYLIFDEADWQQAPAISLSVPHLFWALALQVCTALPAALAARQWDFGSHTCLIIFIKIGVYQRRERNHVLLTTTLSCLVDLFSSHWGYWVKSTKQSLSEDGTGKRKRARRTSQSPLPLHFPRVCVWVCSVCARMRAPELHGGITSTPLHRWKKKERLQTSVRKHIQKRKSLTIEEF